MSVHRNNLDAAFNRISSLEAENRALRARLEADTDEEAPMANTGRPQDTEQTRRDLAALESLERDLGSIRPVEETPISPASAAFVSPLDPRVPAAAAGAGRLTLHEHNLRFTRLEGLSGMRGVTVDCPRCAREGAAAEMVASEAELVSVGRVIALALCLRCGYVGCVRIDRQNLRP